MGVVERAEPLQARLAAMGTDWNVRRGLVPCLSGAALTILGSLGAGTPTRMEGTDAEAAMAVVGATPA